MDKITKLPWEIIFNDEYSVNIVANKDKISETIICQNLHKVNAEYICRAVNSHEGLVEAAKEVIKTLTFELEITCCCCGDICIGCGYSRLKERTEKLEEALKGADGEGV